MTSTTSSNNKRFMKMFKWTLLRNRGIMIVFSILMLVGIVLDMYVLLLSDSFGIRALGDDVLHDTFGTAGIVSIIIAQSGAMLFTLISSLSTFSYLHDKRSTDMFGSLPVTRKTMYFSHLLGGITAVGAPFAIGSFVVMGLTCRTVDYFTKDISIILFTIVCIAAAYSFTALIANCCGTRLDTALVTLGANALWFGIVGIFLAVLTTTIPCVKIDDPFTTPIMAMFSPYVFGSIFDGYLSANYSTSLWLLIVWVLLFTAGVTYLGSVIAKTRKAETAQNEFNIKWLPMVIKAGMSVLCGGFAGLISATISGSDFSNMFVFSFWFIGIGFAAFIILHLIFARGTKPKFMPSLIVYICTTVGALAIVFLMTTGLGLDTYVPDASNVSGATLGYDYLKGNFKDPENIKTITEIHKLVVEGYNKSVKRPYYIGYSNHGYYDRYIESGNELREKYPLAASTDFEFNYNKKVGFKTSRSFADRDSDYDYEKIEALLKKLYSSEEYKKIDNKALYEADGAKINGKLPYSASLIYYKNNDSNGYDSSDINLKTDEEFIKGLYEAVKKDISADKEYYKQRNIVINEKFYVRVDVRYEVKYTYNSDVYIPDTVSINIPLSYKNAVDYLNHKGYEVNSRVIVGHFVPNDDPDYYDYEDDYDIYSYN